MTLGFALLTLAAIFIYAGIHDESVVDVLKGIAKPLPPKGANQPSALSGGIDLGAGNDPGGLAHVDGKPVAGWIAVALAYAKAHGWKGTVTSGYRSAADQARVCSTGVRPCAAPGKSRHQGLRFPSGAVDVTDASTLSQILANSPFRGKLVWAGAQDPVHFSSGGGNGLSGY